MEVSHKLRRAVEESPLPRFKLAMLANLHPATVSKILHGRVRIRPADPRVVALAKTVGIDAADALVAEGEAKEDAA